MTSYEINPDLILSHMILLTCRRKMARTALLLLIFFQLGRADNVPVLFVGSDSNHIPPPSSHPVQKLSETEFEAEYLKKLTGKGPLLFFIQNDLSLEDFSIYGDAYNSGNKNSSFPNLQILLDKYPSLLLPAVETPEKSIGKLEENWEVLQLKNLDNSLKSLDVTISTNTLILIPLPSTESSVDRAAALKKNDEIIGNVVKQVIHLSPSFVFLYTGRKSSWIIDQEERVRISRQILQDEEEIVAEADKIILHDDTNTTLLYTKNITYHISNGSSTINVNLGKNFKITSEERSNTSLIFEISATPGDPELQEIKIIFEFDISRGDWILNNLNASVKNDHWSKDFILGTNNVWAPKSYSFNCKKPGYFQNINDQNDTIFLTFDNLQVQPFLKGTLRFGYPFDCVGFFTIPILTSAFITIILVLILAFGLQQMMNIRTMDRFDDPKGKTISVPNVN